MKKVVLVSIMVLSLCLIGGINIFASGTNPIYGDANEDGKVNVCDLTSVERMILGYESVTPGSDCNNDNDTNMGDIVCIERQILGLAPIYGDANRDYKVDEKDVEAIQNMTLGLIPETQGADANRDGKVSLADVTFVESQIK